MQIDIFICHDCPDCRLFALWSLTPGCFPFSLLPPLAQAFRQNQGFTTGSFPRPRALVGGAGVDVFIDQSAITAFPWTALHGPTIL